MFQKLKKWRHHTYKMREVGRKDCIKGAQIQLDEFKAKLSLFDRALEKLHQQKLGHDEFNKLRKDLGLNTASECY